MDKFSSKKSNKESDYSIKEILKDYKKEPLTISEINKNDFLVKTLSEINLQGKSIGYILVSEQGNAIVNAVKERKEFIFLKNYVSINECNNH